MAKPEQRTHLAVCQWLERQFPIVHKHVIKIDNEGKRTIGSLILCKKMGLHKGASDLFIAWPAHGFHGMWLEIKSDQWKGAYGKKAKEHLASQMEFIDKMNAVGYYATMRAGTEECINAIKEYLKE